MGTTRTSSLRGALGRLDARSRDIVQRRWMTDDKATLHELADKYGVSAERIRQIESSALGKLRGLHGRGGLKQPGARPPPGSRFPFLGFATRARGR